MSEKLVHYNTVQVAYKLAVLASGSNRDGGAVVSFIQRHGREAEVQGADDMAAAIV
jgi:hypothetical protein